MAACAQSQEADQARQDRGIEAVRVWLLPHDMLRLTCINYMIMWCVCWCVSDSESDFDDCSRLRLHWHWHALMIMWCGLCVSDSDSDFDNYSRLRLHLVSMIMWWYFVKLVAVYAPNTQIMTQISSDVVVVIIIIIIITITLILKTIIPWLQIGGYTNQCSNSHNNWGPRNGF